MIEIGLAAANRLTELLGDDMNHRTALIIPVLLLTSIAAFANVYGAIRGVVHDPQHRPIQNAMVMLKAKSSEWGKSGGFHWNLPREVHVQIRYRFHY